MNTRGPQVTGPATYLGDIEAAVNPDLGGRFLGDQAGGSRDGNHRGGEGDEESVEVRGKHRDEGDEGG